MEQKRGSILENIQLTRQLILKSLIQRLSFSLKIGNNKLNMNPKTIICIVVCSLIASATSCSVQSTFYTTEGK